MTKADIAPNATIQPDVYDLIANHGPILVRDMATKTNLSQQQIRKAAKRMYYRDIVNREEIKAAVNGPYLYFLDSQKESVDLKDYQPRSNGEYMDLKPIHAKLLATIKKANKPWQLKYDYPDQTAELSPVIGTLSAQGYIKRWGGKKSPWVLTEKGENTDPSELVESGGKI